MAIPPKRIINSVVSIQSHILYVSSVDQGYKKIPIIANKKKIMTPSKVPNSKPLLPSLLTYALNISMTYMSFNNFVFFYSLTNNPYLYFLSLILSFFNKSYEFTSRKLLAILQISLF